MSVHQKIRANAQHLLETDDKVVVALPATTKDTTRVVFATAFLVVANGLRIVPAAAALALFGVLLLLLLFVLASNENVVIIMTEQRTLVANAKRWRTTAVESLRRNVPGPVQVAPASGILLYKTDVFGETLYIHRKYWPELAKVSQH